MPLIYIIKSEGPKALPWGTPKSFFEVLKLSHELKLFEND